MRVVELFEALSGYKNKLILGKSQVNFRTADEMFMLFYLIKGQHATVVLNDGTIVNEVVRGSFSKTGGPNSWLIVNGKKFWVQAWDDVTIDSVDHKVLNKVIADTASKLEDAKKFLSGHRGEELESSYQKSFDAAVRGIKSAVANVDAPVKQAAPIISKAPKTLQ
jgi:hypothetical protein